MIKMIDKSNGYEDIAAIFIKGRGQAVSGVGVSSVGKWIKKLPLNAVVLDLGCGTGKPITKLLLDAGMKAYAVDASPTMVKAFRQNFPGTPVACEAAEDSLFFNKKFEGVIAWGLLFLLPEKTQEIIIQKAANALKTGGRLLFTSPSQRTEWNDIMTGRHSVSPGAAGYKELLTASKLILEEEFEDEGENHYYSAVKI